MNSLVGVIVVTYNSSSFVIETLESVYNQTWKEIELIITDDCSEDDTVAICRKWLSEHNSRFVRSEIITSEKNTGVSANLNRGISASKSEWVSFPAGDDTLKEDCIEENMSWLRDHPEVRVLFSTVEVYNDKIQPEQLIGRIPKEPFHPGSIMAPDRSAESQYKQLLISDRINFTPSAFINREVILSLGGFDERFRMLEDYPMWLKLTMNGYRLHFMEKSTVNYRQHSGAINNTGQRIIVNPNYFRQELFRRIYIYPYLPIDLRLNSRFVWVVSQVFRWDKLNRDTAFNRVFHSILTLYINPFRYFIWIRKRLIGNLKYNEFYQ